MAGTSARAATVQEYRDELQAERNATWSEDQLIAHATLRQSLEDKSDRARFLKAGDPVTPFVLKEVDGGEVVLEQLLAAGSRRAPVFPLRRVPRLQCGLRGYQGTLSGPLHQLGASLVAISPQAVERLRPIKQRHRLDSWSPLIPGHI